MNGSWESRRRDNEDAAGLERQFIFGALCLSQLEKNQQGLVHAIEAWARDPSIPLSQCLSGDLLPPLERAALEAQVEEIFREHGDNARSTLQRLLKGCSSAVTFTELIEETLEMPAGLSGAVVDTQDVPVVPEIPGRYETKGEQGRGGLGRVLLVRDQFLGRDVALKELLGDAAPPDAPTLSMERAPIPNGHALLRFLQEARITSQLEHPGIVPVYELGRRADGRPYYTMKLVRGKTLDRAIGEASTLEDRLRLLPHFVDTCQAVAFAHSRGVIHRDIKPQNIMVGAFGETVLLDWGLAKLKGHAPQPLVEGSEASNDAAMTSMGQVLGTPAYMAPEQALGDIHTVGEWTDVYALGAVLYTLLSGQKPFSGSTPEEVVEQVLHRTPEPLDHRVERLPSDLGAICTKAMAKEPSQRYASAAELAEEIQRFQTGAVVQAHAYTPRERIARFARRNRAVLAVASVALAVLLIGGAGAISRILDEAARAEYEFYTASIGLAQYALENHPSHESARILAKAPADYRGWEWGYLANLARPETLVLRGHLALVRHGAFSDDGQWIATGAYDWTVRLWESNTGRRVRVFSGLPQTARHPSFNRDATRISAACANGVAIVWDAATGAKIFEVAEPKPNIHSSALSPDGRQLATWGGVSVFKLWDIESGRLLMEYRGHTQSVSGVVFAKDGLRMVSSSLDGTARLWERYTGQTIRVFEKHERWALDVTLSADDSLLATVGTDGTARVYRVDTGEVVHVLTGHTAALVTHAEFTGDGRFLATASEDNTVRLWDVSAGKEVRRVAGLFKANQLLALHPDGMRFLTGGANNTACVRTFVPQNDWRQLQGHTASINHVAFSPDGTLVGTAAGHWKHAGDDRALVWDAVTGQERLALHGHEGPVNAIAFTPDNTRALTAGTDKTVRLWSLRDGRQLAAWREHEDAVRSLALSPGGTRAVTGGWDKTARLWDIEQGTVTAVLKHPDLVDAVAFSPSGNVAASACRDSRVRLWDTNTGAIIHEFVRFRGWAWAPAFSQDGTRLAFGYNDGTIYIVNVRTGRQLLELRGHSNRAQTLVFSRDGRRLFSGSFDKSIKVWDMETGRELLSVNLHGDRVESLALSPDGLTLASGGDDAIAVLSPAFPWCLEDCPGNPDETFDTRLNRYHTEYWHSRFPKLAATGVFNP